jgi:hypothetical protein
VPVFQSSEASWYAGLCTLNPDRQLNGQPVGYR